jgi:tetratricopeptide (TPR) repeat protein
VALVAVSGLAKITPRLFVTLWVFSISLFAQESARPPSNAQSAAASTNQTSSVATAPAPETPIPGLIRSADLAVRNRDYSTCAQLLEQVVAIDPNYKNAWNYLGWTYNALGQYGKAEAALRKAVLVDPSDPRAYNNLGQALQTGSNRRKTLEPLKSSTIVEPVAIVTRLMFLFRFTCSHSSAHTAPIFPVQ